MQDGLYDYIIVGAGSAGCVLANKLSARPDVKVLLIEAGPTDSNMFIHMPKGFAKVAASAAHTYYYDALTSDGGNAPETWIRGRMLGGSSSINGLQYQRGFASDYDHWERDLGLEGWGWRDFLRIYRAMEDHELGGAEGRGVGGPLPISVNKNSSFLMERLINSGKSLGLPRVSDASGPQEEGIGYINATIRKGRRWSAAKAFLDPARSRTNLHVTTDTNVTRILFHGSRATAVSCLRGNTPVKFTANAEIILAAGAIETPALLQRSGVGPGAHLSALGINTVHDSPGVGANLREHRTFTLQYRLSGQYSQNKQTSGWRVAMHGLRYMALRSGYLAGPPYDITAFVRTTPGLAHPDAQLVAGPFSMDLSAWEGFSKGMKMEVQPGAQILGYGLRPTSQGSVMIHSSDPGIHPSIRHSYLDNDEDCRVAIGVVRYMRKLFEQPAIKPYIATELLPGSDVQSDEDILAAYKRMSGPAYHALGTCRMGVDQGSVVDEHLRVRGVQRLRVADISIFPTQVSGNTNGPAMAAAWKASEIIMQTS